ncbi:MAG: hypothetical protein ACMUIE_10245 [Thermoplasmatota archaeon]
MESERERVKKNLGMDLPPQWDDPLTSMETGRDSMVESTERMDTEESSLLSRNRDEMEMSMSDYKGSLNDLTSSLAEFRTYLQKLKDREMNR